MLTNSPYVWQLITAERVTLKGIVLVYHGWELVYRGEG